MNQIINLTPHAVSVVTESGETAMFLPSGIVARVAVKNGVDMPAIAGIPVRSAGYFGEVENLPSPKDNVVYIVSSIVAERCIGRQDVFRPDTGADAIRSPENYQIVAVRRLIQAPQA